MAKRFMYASMGVLCLVAAYHLGSERAAAEWDPTRGGEIFGILGNSVIVDSHGQAWSFGEAYGSYQRANSLDLPVPVSSVKFLSDHENVTRAVLVTTNDEVWWNPGAGEWKEIGPFPGGPVAVGQDSWASVKNRYR